LKKIEAYNNWEDVYKKIGEKIQVTLKKKLKKKNQKKKIIW
jgi:hypothetical protein